MQIQIQKIVELGIQCSEFQGDDLPDITMVEHEEQDEPAQRKLKITRWEVLLSRKQKKIQQISDIEDNTPSCAGINCTALLAHHAPGQHLHRPHQHHQHQQQQQHQHKQVTTIATKTVTLSHLNDKHTTKILGLREGGQHWSNTKQNQCIQHHWKDKVKKAHRHVRHDDSIIIILLTMWERERESVYYTVIHQYNCRWWTSYMVLFCVRSMLTPFFLSSQVSS